MADDELDLDQYFSQVVRDQEVERILSTFRLNPYAILELPVRCTPSDIKKQYRKKSLLLHPDKCKHPRAEEAFSILKKAESELNDSEKRASLNETIREARAYLTKKRKIPSGDPILESDEFEADVMVQTKEILVEDELRRRRQLQAKLREEGEEARKSEEMINERKRKIEERQNWEQGREARVSSWRDFSAKSKGKKMKGSSFKPPKLKQEDSGKPYIQRKANE